jgi:alcohol dehydrogenase, propanol-preferring
MKAMVLSRICNLQTDEQPLQWADMPDPVPAASEILLQVSVYGVCHTELDEIEGRTPLANLPVILGHQEVGTVAEVGKEVTRFKPGDRVGVAWIFSACGHCEFCQAGKENLCLEFQATGRDANGGYAERMTVSENFAYALPSTISAHLVLQMARYQFPHAKIYVFARREVERAFARTLGADWAGDTTEHPPALLHCIIDSTPVWKPIVEALRFLKPAGRLVINAIRKEEGDIDYLTRISYPLHLWLEKEVKSVANVTRRDVEEFLALSCAIPIQPEVQLYPLQEANRALMELKRGQIRGAKVLVVS